MNILNEIDVYDLEATASMLRQYGDACVLWKKGSTASFRWLPSTESVRAPKRRIDGLIKMKRGF